MTFMLAITHLVTLFVRVSFDSSQLQQVERSGHNAILLVIFHRLGVVHDLTRSKVGRYTEH